MARDDELTLGVYSTDTHTSHYTQFVMVDINIRARPKWKCFGGSQYLLVLVYYK